MTSREVQVQVHRQSSPFSLEYFWPHNIVQASITACSE